jgi:hypothetical protein
MEIQRNRKEKKKAMQCHAVQPQPQVGMEDEDAFTREAKLLHFPQV